jgi:hypothetical protein
LEVLDQVVELDNPLIKVLSHYPGVKLPFDYMPVAWAEFAKYSVSLRERIRTELFKRYEFDPRIRELLRTQWETILSAARSKDNECNVINVFTTNYDSLLERGIAGSYEVIDGFRDVSGEAAKWDPSAFDTPPSEGKVRVNLFKLHGSLSWRDKNTGQPVKVVTEEQPSSESKMFGESLLLYPASKIPPVKEPFGVLYGCFTRKLFAVSKCIGIGFSFRDPYLNAVFVDFLRRSKDNALCVISPSAGM